MAFSIGNELWQFKMLFGLCNAPATFEQVMEQILQKFFSKSCLVYLDDVIIFVTTSKKYIYITEEIYSRKFEKNFVPYARN